MLLSKNETVYSLKVKEYFAIELEKMSISIANDELKMS
jgi:hypothetical protein